MFKSIHELTKNFSFLFLLCSFFFLIKGAYTLAIFALISFLLILFVDSDWFFNNFKFPHYNMILITLTYILIFVNFFGIYQEMKYSPLFNPLKPEDAPNYTQIENALFKAIEPCSTQHNILVEKLKNNETIDVKEIQNTNRVCYRTVAAIEQVKITNTLPKEVYKLTLKTQSNFESLATTLSSYNYVNDNSQEWLTSKVKDLVNNSIANMKKAREVLRIKGNLDASKQTFINI